MYHQIEQIKQDNSTHASSFSSFHFASSASWQNETIAETLPQLVATNPSLFLESTLPLVVPLHFHKPLLPLLLPLLPVSRKSSTPPQQQPQTIHSPCTFSVEFLFDAFFTWQVATVSFYISQSICKNRSQPLPSPWFAAPGIDKKQVCAVSFLWNLCYKFSCCSDMQFQTRLK